jgi:hypothetical protein
MQEKNQRFPQRRLVSAVVMVMNGLNTSYSRKKWLLVLFGWGSYPARLQSIAVHAFNHPEEEIVLAREF